MRGPQSFRPFLALLAVALATVASAAPAEAAKPASVTITSPAEVSSGPADVVVSGKATLPPNHSLRVVASTVGDSAIARPNAKGAWSVSFTELILGDTTICAEIYDGGGGYVTSDCVRYTVLPTPGRFTVTAPTEGAEVSDPVQVGGACEYGEFITITTDVGVEWATTCEFYGRTWTAPLSGVPVGPLTITATAAGLDGATVATRTVHVTVVPIPASDVTITSPSDGSTALAGQTVTFAGTATPGSTVTLSTDGTAFAAVWADDTGAWSYDGTFSGPGDQVVCASVSGAGGTTEDCATVRVVIDPASLTVDSPTDGSATRDTELLVTGSCFSGTSITVDAAASSQTVECSASYGVYVSGLPEGPQTITVTMRWDGEVVATRAVTVTVDSTPPAPPVITSPAPGTTITSVPVTLRGTAEPGVTVEVLLPDEMPYVTTTADASGAWSAVLARDYFAYAGVLTGKRATLRVPVRSTDALGNGVAPAVYTYTTRLR